MTNILLTCAGRRNYLIKAFREALSGNGHIIAVDSNKNAPALQEADVAIVVPPANHNEYLQTLVNICTKYSVKLLIPLNDLELPIIARNKSIFTEKGIIPVVASHEAVDICFDKWKTVQYLKQWEIIAPRTYLNPDKAMRDISDGMINFPLIVKPRWGSASICVHTVHNEKELNLATEFIRAEISHSILADCNLCDPKHNLVIQEKLIGTEYGLDIVNDLHGNYACTFAREKLAMRAGETDRAITTKNESLEELGKKISSMLKHCGVLDCDVFLDSRYGYCVLEMNPRFGGGYPFAHAAGANIPAALIAWAEGTIPKPEWLEIKPNVVSSKCDRIITHVADNKLATKTKNAKGCENSILHLNGEDRKMQATDKNENCPLTIPTMPNIEDILENVGATLKSGRISLGDQVSSLENEICSMLGVKNAVAVSSGTSGLMLLIRALDLPKASEVIVPSFTFAATAQALLWNGLKPVFCDCEPEGFTMDAYAAEALITDKTSAILPVCIFGVAGDLDAYQRLADKYGLALIYDSAQGLGATYKNKHLGGFGLGEVFSLSPTKVVTAVEGGLITTNRNDIAEKLRSMRDYGKARDGQNMQWLGLSARMSEINAIIARWSLSKVDAWIEHRGRAVNRYKERLGHIEGITFQKVPMHCISNYNYFVILIDPNVSGTNRDELKISLEKAGVHTKRYFYPALHNQTIFRDIEPSCGSRLKATETIAARSLALPLYSHISIEQVDFVCDRILEHFYSKQTMRAAS